MGYPVYDMTKNDSDRDSLASPLGQADTAEVALAIVNANFARGDGDPPEVAEMILDERFGTTGWFVARYVEGDAERLTRIGEALYGDRWQAPLARDLGVHKDTVQDWRQGRSSPRPGVWDELLTLVSARRGALDRLLNELRR